MRTRLTSLIAATFFVLPEAGLLAAENPRNEKLIAMLESSGPAEQLEAAKKLGELGEPALPALIKLVERGQHMDDG